MMFKLVNMLKRLKRQAVKKQLPKSLPSHDNEKISKNLSKNIQKLKDVFVDINEFIYREFKIGQAEINAAIFHLEGSVDKSAIKDYILESLMLDTRGLPPNKAIEDILDFVKEKALTIGSLTEVHTLTEVIDAILGSHVVLLIDGVGTGFDLILAAGETRAIQESQVEVAIRGPRDAFVEDISTNIIMVRRRLKTPNFKTEKMEIGALTKTTVIIGYVQGIANKKVVEEVKKRLNKIKVDSILESEYIEELIEDAPYSPFSTVAFTERPDKVSAQLLEGRVAIFTDNTPIVLTVPMLFWEQLQAADDYYQRPAVVLLIRFVRLISLLMAIFLPSLYIAVITFHQEMLPTPLLISIAGGREGVPFPALVEALGMELTFEILREAGVRLPRPIGQTVSIAGTLVIGQAAVQAGIVSPAMIIVVALTGVASFAISGYTAALTARILRFPVMLLAGTLGLFGVMLGTLMILVHIVSLRSFGVPYFSPVAPASYRDWKDSLWRAPWWFMRLRPRVIGFVEPQRQETNLKPKPPKKPKGRSGGDS